MKAQLFDEVIEYTIMLTVKFASRGKQGAESTNINNRFGFHGTGATSDVIAALDQMVTDFAANGGDE